MCRFACFPVVPRVVRRSRASKIALWLSAAKASVWPRTPEGALNSHERTVLYLTDCELSAEVAKWPPIIQRPSSSYVSEIPIQKNLRSLGGFSAPSSFDVVLASPIRRPLSPERTRSGSWPLAECIGMPGCHSFGGPEVLKEEVTQ